MAIKPKLYTVVGFLFITLMMWFSTTSAYAQSTPLTVTLESGIHESGRITIPLKLEGFTPETTPVIAYKAVLTKTNELLTLVDIVDKVGMNTVFNPYTDTVLFVGYGIVDVTSDGTIAELIFDTVTVTQPVTATFNWIEFIANEGNPPVTYTTESLITIIPQQTQEEPTEETPEEPQVPVEEEPVDPSEDNFQVRPDEKSNFLYYLANDELGGEWNSTGIVEARPAVSYTLPSPGVIQFLNPVTGTYELDYFVSTTEGLHFSTMVVTVTADAPASVFPDLQNDYFEMEEGTSRSFDLFANDTINWENLLSYGLHQEVHTDLDFDLLPFGQLKVMTATVGTHFFSYYVATQGNGQAVAEVTVKVLPNDVEIPVEENPQVPQEPEDPTNLPENEQPKQLVSIYIPAIWGNDPMPELLPD